MASYQLKNANFRLIYDDGLTEDGKVKRHTKSYPSIDASASADQMYQAAVTISSLSEKALLQAEKQEVEEII
ncbi:DUF1659 domain-containing protein [Chryseomicrobium sp. FSL W7-1435]|uniref:DUF1659 domain-containing protein n=1 Tax=Chryseomicrobium sp. FSL W7-1435 TaxID=2921704 RepID=UPI00315A3510